MAKNLTIERELQMQGAPIAHNEQDRLAALKSYNILDTMEEADFDALTQLASAICHMPVALITVVDKDRQWFKSHHGTTMHETARELSFCAHAINTPEHIMVVPDARADERFAHNSLVTGEPNIVFYAGVPLVNDDGYALGSLCVVDTRKRALTEEQQSSLVTLSRQVMNKLELRRKIKELETSHERLQLALDAGELGSYDVDLASGNIISTAQCKKNFGLAADASFDYADLFNAITPDHRERVQTLVNEASLNNNLYHAEYSITWPDGSLHWISAHGKPQYNNNMATHIVGVTKDITESKAAEERKDDFLSIASHELKTPVTSLKASLQLLNLIKGEPKTDMHVRLIEQANRSMDKMSVLVNDLLNMNGLKDGALDLEKETFNIYEMLDSCCTHVRMAGQYEIVLEGDKALEVTADKHRIDQVVINFIDNAIKYAPKSKTIKICVEHAGNNAKVSVLDSGVGIAAEKIPFLFNRYYRAGHEQKGPAGLGLGLYICAEIIKKHGGQIGVSSEPGKGSTFWFTLPL